MSSRQSPEEIPRRRVGPKQRSAAAHPADGETVIGSGTTVIDGGTTVIDSGTTVVGEGSPVVAGETKVSTITEPTVGELISNRYRLEKVLGEGGMGKVFLAVDQLYEKDYKDRDAQVALKFLSRKFSSHDISRMALQRETRKSQQLAHPNVVRVMHFDQHAGNPYMIMEYMQGRPLDDFLRTDAQGGLCLENALPLIKGMAEGLEYIHSRGLVHSDFKPNNVFVSEDGTAKILDLGIARANVQVVNKQKDTLFDASALGALTPSYASCEMFESQESDPRDDIYALACVSYELLAGRHPFDRTPALQARARNLQPRRLEQLSRDRWHALERGLAFNREERTPSAKALLEGLRGERRRRRLVMLGLTGIAGLAVAAAASLGVVIVQPADPDEVFLTELGTLSADAPSPPSEADSERIKRWLEQGETYLNVASDVFKQGDMLSANQILLEGADTARAAFMSVLKLANSEEAKQGVMKMVDLYTDWAKTRLAEGDAKGALWAACQGARVHALHPELVEVTEDARAELPSTEQTDCESIRKISP